MEQRLSIKILTLALVVLMPGIATFKATVTNKSFHQVDTNQKIENSHNSANINAGDGSNIMIQQGAVENKTNINWEKIKIQIDRVLEVDEKTDRKVILKL